MLAVGVCLAGWIALYALLCYANGSCGYEWNCRLVTLFHGILAVCITAYIGYIDGPWPFTNPGKMNQMLIYLIGVCGCLMQIRCGINAFILQLQLYKSF